MKAAVWFFVVAITLALVALAIPYWLNSTYPWVSPGSPVLRQQGLTTSVPFLGVAFVAAMVAIARRGRPDDPLPRVGVLVLVVLLVLSMGWLLLFTWTWGL
jgi:hypothetical protein